MKRNNLKSMNCIHCDAPQLVDAHCTRFLCGNCAMSGLKFPQTTQLELVESNPTLNTQNSHETAAA